MEITTQRVPQPRGASTYEQGLSIGSAVHAARKTLQGHRTVCDGAPITQWVSGRFEPGASQACPACVAAVSLTH